MNTPHPELKFPIGIQTFEKIRTGGYLYVDKTQYVWDLTQRYSYVFLSRPRRFGKSLLTSTLSAYFSGRKDLFEGLALAGLETEWTSHPVLHFDFSGIKLGTVADFRETVSAQLSAYESQWGIEPGTDHLTLRLENLVMTLARRQGCGAVVLIDEYDAPVLSALHDDALLADLRVQLQAFFAPLKKLDPYLRFVFITGITKFSQISIFSQLNNLHNISMLPEYAAICGISQSELAASSGLQAAVAAMAAERGCTAAQVMDELAATYDGYHFAASSEGLFNPYSLLSALSDRQFNHYWFATGTPAFLLYALQKFRTDITRLEGIMTDASQFDAPTEDMHSALPLFYQSGYLTIRDYDPESRLYTLGYPNSEVRVGVMKILYPYYVSQRMEQVPAWFFRIVKAFRQGDAEEGLELLTSYFSAIPYQEGTLGTKELSEGHFTSLLYVVFSMMNMYVRTQVRTARGRIDILLETKDIVYIMELKLNGSADEALHQIETKGYASPYACDGRKVVCIGMNFSTESRTITDYRIKPDC